MSKKILFIFGTRPEAIKLAPVIKRFCIEKHRYKIKICITAQHRKLLDGVLQVFNIKPDYDLNIMVEGQSLYHITTECLNRLKNVITDFVPDLMIVHGDTTSTFASSLVGYYEKIPVAHVEAGLRSYKKYSPFPEELNRVFVDSISEILFAPTNEAKQNLLKEYNKNSHIFVSGNTVIDAVEHISKICDNFVSKNVYELVNNIMLKNKKIFLVTAHRRENFGPPLENICMSLVDIVKKYPEITIIYPAHPNPNVQKVVKKILAGIPNIRILPPLNYIDFIYLMKNSYLILTDSGGIQEEAAALKIPTLVLREVTERPEGIYSGILKLVGRDREKINFTVKQIFENEKEYEKMRQSKNPYGDGNASERIYGYIEYYFGFRKTKPKEFILTS